MNTIKKASKTPRPPKRWWPKRWHKKDIHSGIGGSWDDIWKK